MPREDYTAVVLVVDRSGSMSTIAKSVQDTLEEFVQKQIHEPGHITIDTTFFDDKVEQRASFVNPHEEKLDLELRPRGMTALYDAVGLKIDSFGRALGAMPEHERPSHVIFVIATDGQENSSTEITIEGLADRIKHQREVYSWDFTFIGANQDAVLTAKQFNIPEHSAITFAATAGGAENVLNSMSQYVAATRSGSFAGYSQEDRNAALAEDEGKVISVTGSKGGSGRTSTAVAAATLLAGGANLADMKVVDLDQEEDTTVSDNYERGQAVTEASRSTFSSKDAAERLGLSVNKLTAKAQAGELYFFTVGRARRYPKWQFTASDVLPELSSIVAAIPASWEPVDAYLFFNSHNTELLVNDKVQSPREWLIAGEAPERVIELLRKAG